MTFRARHMDQISRTKNAELKKKNGISYQILIALTFNISGEVRYWQRRGKFPLKNLRKDYTEYKDESNQN